MLIMEELLQRLEVQIKKLIEQCARLKTSNQHLHHGKYNLTREKEKLIDKQQKAITQIESLILKLKAIEKLS